MTIPNDPRIQYRKTRSGGDVEGSISDIFDAVFGTAVGLTPIRGATNWGGQLAGSGGSGASIYDTFIVQMTAADCPNSQALASLGTGILKSTTGTGVLSIAAVSDLPALIASSLMGNPTGSSAAPSAITLGTNLSFAGSVLNATGGGMANPMTTAGDTIYGGSSGTPTRMAIGTAGQVLGVNVGGTGLEYKTIAAGSLISITETAGTITIAYTGGAAPTTATLSAISTSGPVGVASSTFTITLDHAAQVSESFPITYSGGTITTSPVVIGIGYSTGTFTITPGSTGAANVVLGAGTTGLTPAGTPISYNATSTPATEVFWGWSTLTALTSGQIVALQNNGTGSTPNTLSPYSYSIPSGSNFYYYLCFPDSFGNWGSADIGAFNWSVAGTGDAGGSTYSNTFNGTSDGIPYTYALVTVTNSPAPTVAYRVFRSQYYTVTGASFSIVVT